MDNYLHFVYVFVGLSLRGPAWQSPRSDSGERERRIARLRGRSAFGSVSRARVDRKAPRRNLSFSVSLFNNHVELKETIRKMFF